MMYTRQEMFDIAVRHMHKQEEKSLDSHKWQCMYRAPNGNKCIVGALIKDEYYSSDFEGNAVSVNKANHPDVAEIIGALRNSDVPIVTYEDVSFISTLQHVHDSWDQVLGFSDLFKEFKKFAEYYDLDIMVLVECFGDFT